MSQTFTEFLRQKAYKYKDEDEEKQATLEEWRNALQNLYAQIREWLKVSDPDGILKIKEIDWDVTEPRLGKYKAPRIDLRGLGTWIGFVPKARFAIAKAHPPQSKVPEIASGRVDITDELKRYYLYRFKQDDRDVWMITDLDGEAAPLDKETFEEAVMSFLR